MLDPIAWYIVELHARLSPHLGAERASEITREAESHLREHANSFKGDRNVSDEDAGLAAITAFGRPDLVAMSYLRRARPAVLGIKPVWLVLVGAAVAIYCWDYPWMTLSGLFDNFGESWTLTAALLVGVGALIAFVAGVRSGYRSFRWHILGLGTAICLVLPPLLSFWMISSEDGWQGVSRLHMSRDEATIQQVLPKLDSLMSYYKQAISAFAAAKTPSELPPAFRDQAAAENLLGFRETGEYAAHVEYRLVSSSRSGGVPEAKMVSGKFMYKPGFPTPRDVFAMVDGRIWGLGSTAIPLKLVDQDLAKKDEFTQFKYAKNEWRDRGPLALSGVVRQRRNLAGLLDRIGEARHGRLFFPNPVLVVSAEAPTIFFILILLGVDGITYALTRRRRTLPGRALA